MDRFTSVMIAFCIGVCVAVACIAIGTSSYVITGLAVNPAHREQAAPVQPLSRPKPGIGGNTEEGDKRDAPDEDDMEKGPAAKNPPPDEVAPDAEKRRPRTLLNLLTVDEKNRLWWKIAKAARKTVGDQVTYTLDSATAIRLSREIGCTPEQLMKFFREGPLSDWLDPDWNER